MKLLLTFLLALITLTAAAPQTIPSGIPMPDPIEIRYHRVKKLLCKVPDEQRDDFVKVLKSFGDARGFDWRFCLFIMWNESVMNPKAQTNSYAGLIMFGPDARRMLKVSMEQLLQMNYVEQAKAAVKIWEANEKMMGMKINSFISLQLSTFVPAWMNHHGNPYPASELIKKQNYPFCNSDGEMTKESILNLYRKKASLYEELKYFRGKF